MKEKIQSPICNVSSLDKNQIRDQEEFSWWGLSPEAARKVMVQKPKGLIDKRTTIKDSVGKYLKDGMNIAIGGFVNTRPPVALIHEVIRQGAKDSEPVVPVKLDLP